MSFKVNWSGRGHKYTEAEIDTVVRVMREADPLTQGKYQTEFESKFTSYSGANHSFAVSSCTAALELSAILCGLDASDEVIIPAHTFAATAIPFARTGANIVWADIDPETWVISAETIQKVLSSRTRVIVVVHLYGLAVDMDPILKLAAERNILVVEDAAQAPGAAYKGKRVGSLGDFGCFSFHTHKNMTTLGEGGMLTVRDDQMAKLVPGLRHNGMRPFTHERELYWEPAMSNVDFDLDQFWPYNFCIGEVQCALGSVLLDRLDEMNFERQKRAEIFRERLKSHSELILQKQPEGCGHTYHLMPARYASANGRTTRDDLMKLLAFRYGIKVVVQYYPLYRYPMFQKAGFGEADCPDTDAFFDNMLSFPFHHWLSDDDFETMLNAVDSALHELRSA